MYAQTANIKGIYLDLQVEDHVAEPKVILIVKNITKETINIPEIMIRNNFMVYNYFQFLKDFLLNYFLQKHHRFYLDQWLHINQKF